MPTVDHEMCMLCEECLESCPEGALNSDHGYIQVDYDKCVVCENCIEVCPVGAMG